MKRFFDVRHNKGFTIVELIIVVVIIGVLAALVIVSYSGVQRSARDKVVLSDAEGISGEVARYVTKNYGADLATNLSWYSKSTTNPTNSNIDFQPSDGNVVDVTSDGKEYCIRVYNPSSATYNTIYNAATKGSSKSGCSFNDPSDQAVADSPIGGSLPARFSAAGFETGNDGWTSGYSSTTVTRLTTKPRTGNYSMRSVTNTVWYVNDAAHCGSPSTSCGTLGAGIRKTYTGATVGDKYKLVMWIYTDDTSPRVAYFSYSSSSGQCPQKPLVTGQWTKLECTITAMSTSPYVFFFVDLPQANAGEVMTFYYDDIELRN